jgi:glycosyltransferase involved in cell wall biosynthesis
MWSHYKAVVFSELARNLRENDVELMVVHQAVSAKDRIGLGDVDLSLHDYPYILLSESNLESISAARRIARLVRQVIVGNSSVVIIPGYSDVAYWFALFTAKLMGKACVIAFDSTEADKQRVGLYELVKSIFVKRMDAGFCYGNKSSAYLQKLGMKPDKIRIRCQATDISRISNIHASAALTRQRVIGKVGYRSRNFIYVGRLSEEKNIVPLIMAYSAMKNRNHASEKWGLLLVGEGPAKAQLAAQIKAEAVSDIYFVGGVSWKKVPEYLALADVLVLPSNSEPWGLVVNEAMACAMPIVISSKCGAAGEIVRNGENGIVIDTTNRGSLVDALEYYVKNESEIPRMGSVSKRIIADYTPENAAQQMTAGILELICQKERQHS